MTAEVTCGYAEVVPKIIDGVNGERSGMAVWNHRIVSEVIGDITEYRVAEVFYRNDGSPELWTEGGEILSGFENEADLRAVVHQIQEALDQPVLRVMGDKLAE